MEESEDFLVIYECDIEEEEVESSTSFKPPSAEVSESLVQSVVNQVAQDPILWLSLPSSQRASLLEINCAELTEKLSPLQQCFKDCSIFSSASREKVWGHFHRVQENISSSINTIFNHLPLSYFIVLKTTEKLLATFRPSPSPSSDSTDISSDERDITGYIGGFVLFRSKKFFKKSDLCSSVVECCIKGVNEESSVKLVQVMSRGGLCEPKNEMVSFFVQCEIVFRSECSSFEKLSLQIFIDSVCSTDGISSLFYDLTTSDDTEEKAQETVLIYMLGVFFRLRCHAKCRQMFEKYLRKTKKPKKEKALRKKLVNKHVMNAKANPASE